MQQDSAHPLLAQVPLTVSPFISLPTTITLPYTYKSLPSTLPASSIGDTHSSSDPHNPSADTARPQYVVSGTGHAAHPSDIIASCRALQAHLNQLQEDAEKTLQQWQNDIRERELAEKRRVAPGWLDRDEKILQPERKAKGGDLLTGDQPEHATSSQRPSAAAVLNPSRPSDQGEELDRAFGGLNMR